MRQRKINTTCIIINVWQKMKHKTKIKIILIFSNLQNECYFIWTCFLWSFCFLLIHYGIKNLGSNAFLNIAFNSLMVACLLKTFECVILRVYGDISNIFLKTIFILVRFGIHKHILLYILLLFTYFLKKKHTMISLF